MIAEVVDTGPLRSTGTVYANRTDRASQNVSYGQFGVFCGSTLFTGSAISTCRQDTFFIGDRKGFEYQGDLKLGAFGLFTFGAKAEQEQADSFSQIVLPTPASRLRDIAAEQTTRSAFAQHQITLFDRDLHLTFGGRIDNVLDVAQFETWRTTAAYEIRETGTKLRASAGTGAKAPSLFQLYSPDFGTSTLQPERSIGVDAGIDQMLFEDRLRLSGTVFWNRYRNLIDFRSPDFSVFPVVPIGCPADAALRLLLQCRPRPHLWHGARGRVQCSAAVPAYPRHLYGAGRRRPRNSLEARAKADTRRAFRTEHNADPRSHDRTDGHLCRPPL